jgi:15-cis-phytoene synthase
VDRMNSAVARASIEHASPGHASLKHASPSQSSQGATHPFYQSIPSTTLPSGTDHAKLCEAQMRHGSKSFYAASRLLPKRVRADATALYAFCRVADDAIDLAPNASAQAAALAHLHERLDHIYRAAPLAYAEDIMLAPVVLQHEIPRALLEALLEGFAWDAQVKRYETLDDLHEYCARVAGTVGVMMALLMGVRETRALNYAAELGSAMQLTNIARDVGEDARAGRLYLPMHWMREAGIDVNAWLQEPNVNTAICDTTERLLKVSDRLYRHAKQGISQLPSDCQFAITSAAEVYAQIGVQVRQNKLDSINHRAIVSTRRKLALIARSALQSKVGRLLQFGRVAANSNTDVDDANKFLVDAVKNAPSLAGVSGYVRSVLPKERSFYGRTVWLFELSERLHERERELRES